MKWHPKHSLVLAILGVFIGLAAEAEEPVGLVRVQTGDLPIIISAPHGGQLDVPDVEVRKIEGRPTGGRGYVISRDRGTEELAKFETEIAANGAPPGVMPGCTAIAAGTFEQGRVLCFSPHPERTQGQEALLLRGVLWAAHVEE